MAARVLHLRGLDTLNGTAQDIDLQVGETARFGHLEITAEDCRVPRGDPKADAFAFLSIRDIREADAALLRLDVRLVAGALGARPPALRRLGARLRGVMRCGITAAQGNGETLDAPIMHNDAQPVWLPVRLAGRTAAAGPSGKPRSCRRLASAGSARKSAGRFTAASSAR